LRLSGKTGGYIQVLLSTLQPGDIVIHRSQAVRDAVLGAGAKPRVPAASFARPELIDEVFAKLKPSMRMTRGTR